MGNITQCVMRTNILLKLMEFDEFINIHVFAYVIPLS